MDDHISLNLEEKKELTPNVTLFTFSKPAHFSFVAGQFVQFVIQDDSGLTYRSYSLSSAPTDAKLEFCVKLLSDGKGSNFFRNLIPGATAYIRGPRGKFILNNTAEDHYFIATGVGIAPIMSMMRNEIEYNKTSKNIRLLFGVRSEEDLFWIDQFEALKKSSSNFSYSVTLSQPKQGGNWSGLTGRVTEHILSDVMMYDAYLCGSVGMVKDVRTLLLNHGMESHNIHFEIF